MSLSGVLCTLLAIVGVMLMFVILLQRGRGGGLAGAFGGLGGQSAFGTKAGDVFTRITIGMAVVWVALAAGAGFAMRWETQGRFKGAASNEPTIGAPAGENNAAAGEDDSILKDQKEPATDADDAKSADDKGGPQLPGEPATPKAGAEGEEKSEATTPAAKPAETPQTESPESDASKSGEAESNK